jgi:abortive infection bacteriophage resistance protein
MYDVKHGKHLLFTSNISRDVALHTCFEQVKQFLLSKKKLTMGGGSRNLSLSYDIEFDIRSIEAYTLSSDDLATPGNLRCWRPNNYVKIN